MVKSKFDDLLIDFFHISEMKINIEKCNMLKKNMHRILSNKLEANFILF